MKYINFENDFYSFFNTLSIFENKSTVKKLKTQFKDLPSKLLNHKAQAITPTNQIHTTVYYVFDKNV